MPLAINPLPFRLAHFYHCVFSKNSLAHETLEQFNGQAGTENGAVNVENCDGTHNALLRHSRENGNPVPYKLIMNGSRLGGRDDIFDVTFLLAAKISLG